MHRLGALRLPMRAGLAALVWCGGCAALKHTGSTPYQLMEGGPDTSAIIIVDVDLYAEEERDRYSSTLAAIAGGFLDGMMGGADEPKEPQGDPLRLEGGDLHVSPSGTTIAGFASGKHLVFLDVPPGAVRLTEVRGYRTIETSVHEEIYDCDPAALTFSCPAFWVYRFRIDTEEPEGLRFDVRAGEVVYVGQLAAGGVYGPPPYRHVGKANIQNNYLLGVLYEQRVADYETVEMVTAGLKRADAEERVACASVLELMENEGWKTVLEARLAGLEETHAASR